MLGNNNSLKSTKLVSPFPNPTDRKISPETSKYTNYTKQNFESIERDNAKVPGYFSTQESPISSYDKPRSKIHPYLDDPSKLSLAELNLELDNNMNEILFCLNKRKQLIINKKKKLKEEYMSRSITQRLRNKGQREALYSDETCISSDDEMSRLSCFVNDPQEASKVINSLLKDFSNLQDRRISEEEKSNEFWNSNTRFETEIDTMLVRLKQIDLNLDRQTTEVAEICKNLDTIEDSLKDLLLRKSEDHLRKAEPLFNNKKKTYEQLNIKIYERERIKDEKIEYTKKIREYLTQLKLVRQNRIKEIYHLFGVNDTYDASSKICYYKDCVDGLQELVKIKEKSAVLDSSERELSIELDNLLRAQEALYAEIVKKQSDEARAYQNYESVLRQKSKYAAILNTFSDELHYVNTLQNPDVLHQYRAYREALKSFADEDRLIREGLQKTNETYRTFTAILKATENEKERRKELLNVLESCARLKHEEDSKKEQLRNLSVEAAKRAQQKNHIEDEIQTIMADCDLDSYKQIGLALNNCEKEMGKLAATKKALQSEIQSINRELVCLATNLRHEYDDILKDILPSNFEYNLKSIDDIKQVKNYIRKTFKRLGLIPNKDE